MDRNHNVPGTRLLPADPHLWKRRKDAMLQESYEMDDTARRVVLEAVREICIARDWQLIAAHIRTKHAHLVVYTEAHPDIAIGTCKAFATKALRAVGLSGPNRKHWSHGGSCVALRTGRAVSTAVHYVIEKQGEPMAVFCAGRA